MKWNFFRDYTVWDTAGWNKISFAPKDAVRTIENSYGKKEVKPFGFAELRRLASAKRSGEAGSPSRARAGQPAFAEASARSPCHSSPCQATGHSGEGEIKICAFLLHNNFNCPDPQKEVQWVIDVIKTAEDLKIPAIRIDAITKGEKEEPFEIRVTRFVDCMRQALEATNASTVALGIENHGIQGNDPAFLKQVMERVGNERLGVNMDTGNFYWNGFPLNEVYDILRSVAPYTKHTHVKNIRYPEDTRQQKRANGWEYGKYVSPIYEGDIDHQQVVAILKNAGYNGPLTIEDECLGKLDADQKKEVLRKDAVYLNSLLA